MPQFDRPNVQTEQTTPNPQRDATSNLSDDAWRPANGRASQRPTEQPGRETNSSLVSQATEQANTGRNPSVPARESSTLIFQAAEKGIAKNVNDILREQKPVDFAKEIERLSKEADKNLPEAVIKRIEVMAKKHAEQLITGSFGGARGLCVMEDSFDDALRAEPHYGAGLRRLFQEINKELATLDWTGRTRLEIAPGGLVIPIKLMKDGRVADTMGYVPNAERLEKKK